MATQFRKNINQDIADKLLLNEASAWAIVKHIHKNRMLTMFECALVAGILGVVLGVSL